MCIICNCKEYSKAPDEFISAFESSRASMKKACDSMKRVSEEAISEEHAKRYDRTHKKMVRLLRDWNRIEQERESNTRQE